MSGNTVGVRRRLSPVLVVLLAALAVLAFAILRATPRGQNAELYDVAYDAPKGWEKQPPGPLTLFVYRHPDGKAMITASLNEVHFEVNPTPELDTDGLADQFVGVTHDNMPGWTAQRLEDFSDGSERFSVIKRTRQGRTVYNAFCAKGNSTVLVSLTAGGKAAGDLERHVPVFKRLLASIRLSPKKVARD
jgi:hypothetical protein